MGKVEEMLTNLWLGAGLKNTSIHLWNMHLPHKSIMKRTVDQTKFNPKTFHSYIKYQKVRHPTVGSFRTTEEKTYCNRFFFLNRGSSQSSFLTFRCTGA